MKLIGNNETQAHSDKSRNLVKERRKNGKKLKKRERGSFLGV